MTSEFPGETGGGNPTITTPVAVAMLNRQGGRGKTSTCHHLAGCFARNGRRVLLVDTDPQASLTQGFFGPQVTEVRPKQRTVASQAIRFPRETTTACLGDVLTSDRSVRGRRTAADDAGEKGSGVCLKRRGRVGSPG
jgi:CO dehydrogenase nickel-insertion accessory protein CooC1